MTRLLALLSIWLGTHVLSATAGTCFSDQSNGPVASPKGKTALPKKCIGGPPTGGLWACEDPSIDFPTVECLMADMKTCGIITNGAPSVFYSFNIKGGAQISALRDRITPTGNLYNDEWDEAYWTRVMTGRKSVFRLDINARLQVLIARSAEAFGRLASGDVFVYVPHLECPEEPNNGLLGSFQTDIPDPNDPNPGPNIFQTFELPSLQRNPAVTRIISVDINNNDQQHVDWENGQSPPGLNNPLLPASTASAIVVPPVPAAMGPFKRDSNTNNTTIPDPPTLCPLPLPVPTTTSTVASSGASTITSPPGTPTCVLHKQDPDQGITQAFCLCDSTATLSPLSVPLTGQSSDSCAYTTIPATAKEAVTTFASTYTSNCQACTEVGLNAPSCTTIAKCTPTNAQVTVQAGSSAVHVGTLTGTALYTSISSALEKLCPTVTQTKSFTVCETSSVAIQDIEYVSADSLDTGGELVIKVAASSYNTTSLRDAMIKSAAVTAQKVSEKPSSCSNQTYITQQKRGVGLPPSRVFGRKALDNLFQRDRPEAVVEHSLLCHTNSFAGVGYFSPQWRQAQFPGAEAYIDATWEFQAAPGGDFLCDFIEDLEIGLAVIAPEFALQDVATVPEVQAFCAGTLA
ncbi:uncharacterized protein Z519_11123 [Cladophialophora bantiana CBS 173.52]|uniref:Uncharacterized protein n=1 Tax=Cladophialophora bantiana (strain ATCC 10958 / CBS 173.52 / CDC B-1940 / NIH 8579) TaxID=1442370 RepID=A0A0D2H433_CLAB1|nr:uncharacterized protein Z519_11123 [Cladophialophora bantiana CBS 173.52]KIW88013.1 hypothetical protein Z519_11123 [Cladophialophora bantiana CBS 173.52]